MGIDVRRTLLHWAAYSAEARNPLRLPAFCVRACRSRGGVRRSSSQIAIRIAFTHSTRLPFPAQFACALFVLDIAGDGAKSVPDGQKPRQSCCKEDAQKARGAFLAKVLGGVAWMELHAVLLLGLDTCAKPGFA